MLVHIYKYIRALLVFLYCSQSVKDRVSCPPFGKASAKVRPFYELAKSFGNFFSGKREKDGFWTKKRQLRKISGSKTKLFEQMSV